MNSHKSPYKTAELQWQTNSAVFIDLKTSFSLDRPVYSLHYCTATISVLKAPFQSDWIGFVIDELDIISTFSCIRFLFHWAKKQSMRSMDSDSNARSKQTMQSARRGDCKHCQRRLSLFFFFFFLLFLPFFRALDSPNSRISDRAVVQCSEGSFELPFSGRILYIFQHYSTYFVIIYLLQCIVLSN